MAATPLTPSEQAQWADTRQPAIYGSLSVFLALANTAFFARLFCQLRFARTFLLDDAFLALALLLADAVIALFLLATQNGFGLHLFRILDQDPHAPQNVVTLFKYIFITSVLQVACLASVKLSLLFLYRRVFLVQQRWLLIAWWANLVYIVLWFFGAFFFFTFQCLPVSYYWKRFYATVPSTASYAHGSCNPTTSAAVTAILILSLMSDVGLLILPVGTIATLNMTRRRKGTLEAVFGLGVIAVGVSIARIVSITQVNGDDPSYSIVNFMILTSAEQITAIVCACGPIVIPAAIKYIRRMKTSKKSTPSQEGLLLIFTTWCYLPRRLKRAPDDTIKLTEDAPTISEVAVDPRTNSLEPPAPPEQIMVKTEVRVER